LKRPLTNPVFGPTIYGAAGKAFVEFGLGASGSILSAESLTGFKPSPTVTFSNDLLGLGVDLSGGNVGAVSMDTVQLDNDFITTEALDSPTLGASFDLPDVTLEPASDTLSDPVSLGVDIDLEDD
jgi:hypothetical protein